jgi:hypothetical protein
VARKGKSRSSKKRLNVICHGLMVFWFDTATKKVVIRIPCVPDGHSYGAGFRGQEKTIPHSNVPLQLVGVTAASCSTVNSDERTVLDQQNGALEPDLNKLHRSIEIPFPDEVLAFRFARAPKGGFFSGSAQVKYRVSPRKLPMVHAFTYVRFSTPLLQDKTNQPFWKGRRQGTQNLHIFAEPALAGNYHHWPYLTKSFRGGLDLNIKPTPTPVKVESPNRTGLKYGIAPKDMKSLRERYAIILGGPPPNCMPLFVV